MLVGHNGDMTYMLVGHNGNVHIISLVDQGSKGLLSDKGHTKESLPERCT
jgi:hypothetical protein